MNERQTATNRPDEPCQCVSRACIHSKDGPCRSTAPSSSSASTDLRHEWNNLVSAGSREVGGVRLSTVASLRRGEKQCSRLRVRRRRRP